MIDAVFARVIAPRPAAAWVRLRDDPSAPPIKARNQLNLRVPPGSVVIIAKDEQGRYHIVGRER